MVVLTVRGDLQFRSVSTDGLDSRLDLFPAVVESLYGALDLLCQELELLGVG